MRMLVGSIFAAAVAASLGLSPTASADPDEVSNLPACTTASDGSQFTGTQTTECSTPGNVQIDAAAPDPVYTYPWDEDFYGPAFIIGGGGGGGRR